jgi:L-malate glycosyltransferase
VSTDSSSHTARREIVQWVPALYPRDAVGGHIARLHDGLQRRGFASKIVVEAEHIETAHLTTLVGALPPAVNDNSVNVYHVATGSALAQVVAARPEPLAIVHHNLTPIDLVAPWDAELVYELTLARRQLETLARRADLGIGDSEHNRAELVRLGCQNTTVVPLVFDLGKTTERADSNEVPSTPTIVFVGRFAPNKAHEDLIAALALLSARHPSARLRLIGGSGTPTYMRALHRLVESLDVGPNIEFVHAADPDVVIDAYRHGDVFCCLSDHEGFAMPLIEAMHHGMPVVAYGAAAVPGTVGAGGMVLQHKDPATVATALDRVLTDRTLAASMAAAGRARAAAFSPAAAIDSFVAAIESIGS